MATTPQNGQTAYPTTANAIYSAVEKLAVQNITALKGANPISNAFYEYNIDGNGNVIEEAVIEMASAGNYSATPNFNASDPTLKVRYFNNFTTKQFKTTIRKNDLRKVLAGTESVEGVTTKILTSLDEGEANYDMLQMASGLHYAVSHAGNLTNLIGQGVKVCADMKAVIYAIREGFNYLTSTNKITADSTDSGTYAVDPSNVRIAIHESVLNLIDVTELANVFNLEKEQLFGMIVKIPFGTDFTASEILIYDVRAMGRATRVFEYSQDVVGSTLYTNHFLTTERAYFMNPLFKRVYINCSKAVTDKLSALFVTA